MPVVGRPAGGVGVDPPSRPPSWPAPASCPAPPSWPLPAACDPYDPLAPYAACPLPPPCPAAEPTAARSSRSPGGGQGSPRSAACSRRVLIGGRSDGTRSPKSLNAVIRGRLVTD